MNTITDKFKAWLKAPATVQFAQPPSSPQWTYASEQATKCAVCGQHKHTPLRRDEMGGYVCLTCIDKRLDDLHGVVAWVAEQENLFFAEASQAEEIVAKCRAVLEL